MSRRKDALVRRIAGSQLGEDAVRVERELHEASRLVNEADCAMPFRDRPEDPANVAGYPALLDSEARELEAAETAFARAAAACPAG